MRVRPAQGTLRPHASNLVPVNEWLEECNTVRTHGYSDGFNPY